MRPAKRKSLSVEINPSPFYKLWTEEDPHTKWVDAVFHARFHKEPDSPWLGFDVATNNQLVLIFGISS